MIPIFSAFAVLCLIQVSTAQTTNYYCGNALQDQAPAAHTIPNDYTHFNNSYFKYHTRFAPFAKAVLACEAEGAHLAIIKSTEEGKYLGSLLSGHEKDLGKNINNAFVGFHDSFEQGQWTTILGKSLGSTGYISWDAGQPDNYQNNEHCGSISPEGFLHDTVCATPLPFICEIENCYCY